LSTQNKIHIKINVKSFEEQKDERYIKMQFMEYEILASKDAILNMVI
jgi:hypothetical protein